MLAWSRDSEEEPESVNVGAGPSTANETYEISGSIAAALFEDAELEVDTEIEIDGSDTLHLEIPDSLESIQIRTPCDSPELTAAPQSLKLEVPACCLEEKDIVQVCVGASTFWLPRALLIFHSEWLAQELDGEQVIVLHHYTDNTDIFEQCVAVLKGQETEITTENFKDFLKFSIIYQVEIMHYSLQLWIKTEVTNSRVSFLFLHECARVENSRDKQREGLLNMCRNFLENSGLFIIKRELNSLPVDSVTDSFLSLLVDPSYISYTLPVLTRLVDSQSRAEFILSLVSKERVLEVARTSKYFTETFLSHLYCLLEDSSKTHMLTLIRVQEFLLKSPYRPAPSSSSRFLAQDSFLSSLKMREMLMAMSLESIMRERVKLTNVVFAELVLEWLRKHVELQALDTTAKKDKVKKAASVQKFWKELNDPRLFSQGFLYDLKVNLETLLKSAGEITELKTPAKSNFLYNGYGFSLTTHNMELLRDGYPIYLTHKTSCRVCDLPDHGLSFQLVDSTPCYSNVQVYTKPGCHSHILPTHWWLTARGNTKFVSLITNAREDIMRLLDGAIPMYACCMFEQ